MSASVSFIVQNRQFSNANFVQYFLLETIDKYTQWVYNIDTTKERKRKGERKMKKFSFCTVWYESEVHMGCRTCFYGELTALKKQFKEDGKKITEIDYCDKNGNIIERKIFN